MGNLKYSRLARLEQERTQKKIRMYILGIILLTAFVGFFGISILSKISSFLMSLNQNQTIEITDKTPPPPPSFRDIPEYTNKRILVLTGRAEPGSRVQITSDTDKIEIVANSEGNFDFELKLDKEKNTFSGIAVDNSGNQSYESKQHTIVFDDKKPEIEIKKPEDGATFFGKDKNISIEGTTENEATVYVNDRIAIVNSNGGFSLNLQLNDGSNEIKVKAIDKAGNESEKVLNLTYSP